MTYFNREKGAVLIVSLMLLLVMTLIGVTALQSTSLELKMAGNTRDRALAFEAAEVALREGENFFTNVALPNFNGTNGLYSADNNLWKTIDWTDGTKVILSDALNVDGAIDDAIVAAKPSYYLEELPLSQAAGESLVVGFAPAGASGNYRVTAHGFGGTTTSHVVLQATYRR